MSSKELVPSSVRSGWYRSGLGVLPVGFVSRRTIGRARKAASRAIAIGLKRQRGLSKLAKAVRRWKTARNARFNKNRKKHNYKQVTAKEAGTTHTTSRMIVRKTPPQQKFLRKLFRNNPKKIKYIERYGFSWMGSTYQNQTVWYSCTHLKFNNLIIIKVGCKNIYIN